MDIERVRDYALGLPGATEDMPFGEGVLVFRVGGKMFMLVSLDVQPLRINLKCDPERALELRAQYSQITPGWHMSKKHWNTLTDLHVLGRTLVEELIGHSYELVRSSLPRAVQASLPANG